MKIAVALLLILVSFVGSGAVRVDPPEGRVSLGPGGNPYGLKQIIIYGDRLSLNEECEECVAIYLDGSATAAEKIPVSEAILDVNSHEAIAIVFKGEYREEGSYRVEVPGGFFFSGEEPNGPLTLDYYIRDMMAVSPPDGSSMTSLSEWMVDAIDADELECVSLPAIAPDGTGEIFTLQAERVRDESGRLSRIRLFTESPLRRTGTWRLQLDQGAFRMKRYGPGYPSDPDDVEISYSDERRLTYHVVTTPEFGISPGEGEISRVYQFRLMPPDGFGLRHVEPSIRSSFMAVDRDGLDVEEIAVLRCFDAPEPVLTVIGQDGLKALEPLALAPGRYALRLAPDTFYGRYAGMDTGNSQFTYYYEVPRKVFEVSVTPPEWTLLPTLGMFRLHFVNADYLSVNREAGAPSAWLEKEGERPGCDVRVSDAVASESGGMEVALTIDPPVVGEGLYRLVLPEGCFFYGRDHSPAYSFSFRCDGSQGVGEVPAGEEKFDIFTPEGIRVASGVSRAECLHLSPGIYIAGGRKIVVRRY